MENSVFMSIFSKFSSNTLNLNIEKCDDKRKLDILCGDSKMVHLRAVTTVQRNQLDHIIIETRFKHQIHTDSFFNFISDHKCIVMRQSQYANDELAHIKQEKATKIKKEKITADRSHEKPAFYRLIGEHWLDDDTIDQFALLLNKKYNDIFVFPTYFCQTFFNKKKTYYDFKKYDKSGGLFDKRVIMIPLLQHSHWFLCVLEYHRNVLYILDPYIKEKDLDSLRDQHLLSLRKIQEDFLQVHMRGDICWAGTMYTTSTRKSSG